MKSIQNKSICTWYYAFFIINAIVASFALLILIVQLAFVKKVGMAKLIDSLSTLIVLVIGSVNALFFYLMCDRALLQEQKKLEVFSRASQ